MNPFPIKVLLGCLAVQALCHASLHAGGFVGAAAGAKEYAPYAPPLISAFDQRVNEPLGEKRADAIARKLGLDKSKCFTQAQFVKFVAGQGVGGSPKNSLLVDKCVFILTNTTGNPLIRNIDGKLTRIVIGSYGLTVNRRGLLESPANKTAPTRRVNALIAPGAYVDTWCRANGATDSIVMLYGSAFTVQAAYGNRVQQTAGAAELAIYRKGPHHRLVAGLAVAPPLWEVNFCLIYMLNPKLAANMPAYWTPVPKRVAVALKESPTGRVPYGDYAPYFKQ